ncbi:MAG TPA: hypothetical protein VLH56_12485, partial [Dissulfurispiraceae bacterium]|nr:hypothetical protein [Dissulfurispiraceae bacterium]
TLDAKCTAKNDSLRGSSTEKLGSIHVRTSPEIDPAEPQRDFFSSLLSYRRAQMNGCKKGIESFMHDLRGIRSALLLYPGTKNPHRQLCSLSESQSLLLNQLDINLQES